MVSERGLKLIPFLKEFNLELKVSGLESRLIMERIVYFLQEFGAKIGYTFGWYVFGPYSTHLIDEVHEISYDKKVSEMKIPELSVKDERVVKKCKEFIKDLIGENNDQKERWLHLACVIHFLNKYYHEHLKDVESFEKMFSKFETNKHQLNEIERGWKILKKHKLSPSNVKARVR
jgi:uncharacterized protein YwgA